jgi:hypothetical protein
MSLDAAYSLLPLPYGDWVFWLPFPLMSFLCFGLSLLVLASVAAKLHSQRAHPLLRNAIVVCIPLWVGALWFLSVRVWLFWTLGWFYVIVLAAIVVGFLARDALLSMLAVLLAALLYHQGSVIMVITMAET